MSKITVHLHNCDVAVYAGAIAEPVAAAPVEDAAEREPFGFNRPAAAAPVGGIDHTV